MWPKLNLSWLYSRSDKWIQGIRSRRWSAGASEELWTEVHNIGQEAVTKTIPKNKKCKKAKWLSEEALQVPEKREAESKGERERYTQLNAEFQRIVRKDKEAFLKEQCK